MEPVAIVLWCLAVVAIVITVAVLASREVKALREAWMSFARERGYAWNEARGPWYRHAHANVQGELDGVRFVLDRFVVSTGKSTATFTRVCATLRKPLREKLVVRRNTWFRRKLMPFAKPIVATGDSRFDRVWMTRCKDSGEAKRVVDARVRAALLALAVPVQVDAGGNEVRLVWHGSERRTKVLDGAIEVAVGLARAADAG